ncbi:MULTISPECIES: type II secretion system protein [unclassified Lebetimonas]|uniref:type II secretion system protein n=1 Tax=unclassified Lebetimonas TaxID=2648158 RepID=UPI00046616A9|nr:MULTISPECIES: type II secretion system protein [unclassified Lebetimonas]
MRAFSLIELIFVLVIMGILSFVGMQFIPNETPLSDSEILKKLILTKKTNALGYKIFGENNETCIKLTKNDINSEENASRVKYRFKSDIQVSGLSGDLLCFDYMGRPYDGGVDEKLTHLLKNFVTITLNYKNKEKNLTLYPVSGYVR